MNTKVLSIFAYMPIAIVSSKILPKAVTPITIIKLKGGFAVPANSRLISDPKQYKTPLLIDYEKNKALINKKILVEGINLVIDLFFLFMQLIPFLSILMPFLADEEVMKEIKHNILCYMGLNKENSPEESMINTHQDKNESHNQDQHKSHDLKSYYQTALKVIIPMIAVVAVFMGVKNFSENDYHKNNPEFDKNFSELLGEQEN